MPDIQLHFCMAMVDDHGRKPQLGHRVLMPCLPVASREPGSVRLQSADPAQRPAIDPNFLGAEADLRCHGRRFQNDKTAARCAGAEGAANPRTCSPQASRSDGDIRKVLRQRVDTVYHPVGTCKMGTGDPLAVVDPQLQVHGIEACVSSMPR